MKVRILVTRKPGVLDPEGRALQSALHDLGYAEVQGVDTGTVLTLDLATDEPERAETLARQMCDKLLANPVIERAQIDVLHG